MHILGLPYHSKLINTTSPKLKLFTAKKSLQCVLTPSYPTKHPYACQPYTVFNYFIKFGAVNYYYTLSDTWLGQEMDMSLNHKYFGIGLKSFWLRYYTGCTVYKRINLIMIDGVGIFNVSLKYWEVECINRNIRFANNLYCK